MIQHRLPTEWAFLRISRVMSDSGFRAGLSLSGYQLSQGWFSDYIRSGRNSGDFEARQRDLGARSDEWMLTVVDLQEGATEYLFHQSAIIRRQAQVLEGTRQPKSDSSSKCVFGGSPLCWQSPWVVVFLLTFLHQHHRACGSAMDGNQIERMTQLFPQLDTFGMASDLDFWISTFALRPSGCAISSAKGNPEHAKAGSQLLA